MCCSFEILGEILSISDMPSNSIFLALPVLQQQEAATLLPPLRCNECHRNADDTDISSN